MNFFKTKAFRMILAGIATILLLVYLGYSFLYPEEF